MLNLSIVLEDSARDHADETALVFKDTSISYAELNAAANQVANLLTSHGLGRGDNIALSCPNLPYFVMVYFGILKTGATVVPLNVLLQTREIAYHLRDSDAKAYFCFDGTPELPMGERGRAAFEEVETCGTFFPLPGDWSDRSPAYETVLTDPDETAVILYTSGTTGQPKGAELTHQNMLLNATVCDEMFETFDRNVMLCALPLFHSFGQTVLMNQGLRRAATVVLVPRFDPVEVLETMNANRATYFAGVPTMYWAMLAAVRDGKAKPPEGWRTAISGGAALPMEVLEAVEKTFGLEVHEGYGLSETSPVATFNRPGRTIKPGTIGQPIWGVECKLIDDDWNTVTGEGPAELAIRGHLVMKGYHNRPEATDAAIRDGWFRSGDIATRDSDGYYTIVDRKKDMIIRSGFNVYPREVEEVLMTHESVSLAAVLGVPHDELGEEVKAYVIRTPGSTTTAEELIAWSAENMAGHKFPRIVEFVDSLPMTATGKILKKELR